MTSSRLVQLAGLGLLVSISVAGGFAGVGCSSSSGPSNGAPSPTATSTSITGVEDAGPPVGTACSADTDCPSAEKCSNDVYSGGNPIYPTPVCLAACTPPSDPTMGLAACGTGTIPGAGICQPPDTADESGLCLPLCVVTPSGEATGCLVNDVCEILGTVPDPTTAGQTDGAGWCLPGCTQDSQCPAGSKCDPLEGACAVTPIAPALPIGATCDSSAATTQCNCVSSAGSTEGFCTAVCVTGVSTCPVPPTDGGAPVLDSGAAPSTAGPWVCTAQTSLTASLDGGLVFSTQPTGLYGLCAPACRTNADCAQVGGHCSQGDPAAPSGYTGTCSAGPTP